MRRGLHDFLHQRRGDRGVLDDDFIMAVHDDGEAAHFEAEHGVDGQLARQGLDDVLGQLPAIGLDLPTGLCDRPSTSTSLGPAGPSPRRSGFKGSRVIDLSRPGSPHAAVSLAWLRRSSDATFHAVATSNVLASVAVILAR